MVRNSSRSLPPIPTVTSEVSADRAANCGGWTWSAVCWAPIRATVVAPEQVTSTELAGEKITAALTAAPGNGAAIGGLKLTTENAWAAARPSGTENVYKIYAESFRSEEHLREVQEGAREVVNAALG